MAVKVPDPVVGGKTWDARWTEEQQDLALYLAKQTVQLRLQALEAAANDVEWATDWVGTVTYFRAAARARKRGVPVEEVL